MQREKIQLIRDGLETAYVNGNTASELLYKPNFVSNNHNEGKKVLSVIEDELLKCDKFQISVAFITLGGVTPLLQTLKELEKREIPGEILTSNYLDFSEPQALEKLNSLKNIRIKMYDTNSAKNGFHTKGYIFKEEEVYRIIIGSSNMTSAALTTNREWNTKLVSTSQGEVAEDILKEFDELWNSEYALDYDVFYEEYKQRYEIIKEQRKIATERNVTSLERYKLKPNSMQVRFITNLKNILKKDEKRALLMLRVQEKRMLLLLLCVNLDLNVSYLLCIGRHWQFRRRSLIRECLATQFRWDWLVQVIMNMIKIMYLRL